MTIKTLERIVPWLCVVAIVLSLWSLVVTGDLDKLNVAIWAFLVIVSIKRAHNAEELAAHYETLIWRQGKEASNDEANG